MAAIPFLPPGGLLEIVFSFDTTGSMSSILEEVQGRLQDMIQRLQADIPGIRIGVIAHGDYCDEKVFYLTKQLDLTQNVAELCEFVKGVDGTGGGDADECYELILRMVRQNFSWTPASQKILVMIGDANPHGPDYELNVDHIDWKQEVDDLKKMGVKIYGVQVFENEGVDEFYKTMSSETEGHYLKLGEFSNIVDFLMAICYRERGDDLFMGYEAEVRSRYGKKGIHKDLEGLFGTLRRTDSASSSQSSAPVAKVAPVVLAPPTPVVHKDKTIKKTGARKRTDPKKRDFTLKTIKKRENKKTNDKEPREKVSQRCFSCGNLEWSGWRKAYIPTSDSVTKKGYTKQNGGHCLKRTQIFYDKCRKTALYELSVQTKPRGKRYVMYSKVTNGHVESSDWESRVLYGGVRRLQQQIYNVVRTGCTVFIRRAFVSKRKSKILQTLDNYSYAWHRQKDTKLHRFVMKDSITLSMDSI